MTIKNTIKTTNNTTEIFFNGAGSTLIDTNKLATLPKCTVSFNGVYPSFWDGKKQVLLHRHIISAKPGQCVDHINGDKLDNRVSNLRICTRAQNMMNLKNKCGKTSRYKGVYYSPKVGKYLAQIRVNKKLITIGAFADEIDAAKAYNLMAKKHFKEFASLNNIKEGI